MLDIKWIGQGGYELDNGEAKLVFDPYMSDMVEKSSEGLKRLVPPVYTPDNFKTDIFVSSHDHMDHLDHDFIKQIDVSGITFICPTSCVKTLAALRGDIDPKRVITLDRGSKTSFGGYAFEGVYADHTDDSIGIVLKTGGITLYFTGDTLYCEKVGAGLRADVIFCCINGRWGNMNEKEAVSVAKRVGAKTAVPNHYGMFAENTADPENFIKASAEAEYKTFVMEYGNKYAVCELL